MPPTCFALALLGLALWVGAPDGSSADPLRWRLEAPARDETGVLAAAVAPDGRLAIGDGRGVRVLEPGASWRAHSTQGAVLDLAFDARGALWVATETGLFRLARGRLEARSPGPAAGRSVSRVATGSGAIAIATETGVFWSGDGQRWEHVEGSFGPPPATGLALDEGALWIAAPRGLFRTDLPPAPAGWRAEPVTLPVEMRPALDVRVDGEQLTALARDRVVYRPAPSAAWQSGRPVLPPGAEPLRIAAGAGRLWIATDRGLLTSHDPEGPWQREAGPAGNTSILALAFDARGETTRVLAAAAQGLWVGAAAVAAVGLAEEDCAPPVGELHSAALRHVSLDLRSLDRLGRGVHRRGWFPLLTLRADAERSRDRGSDHDEAFLSGETRLLHDRDRGDSTDRNIALTLSWDLADLAYNPEEIDVSSERRRLIELRDDVLDEINQLYFERRRALAAAPRAPASSPEAYEARLRAQELAAGLDGWTGGWFGARLRACTAVHR